MGNLITSIPTFNSKDLHGKTLLMFYTEDSGIGILVGKDTDTGVIYVLGEVETDA